MEKRVRTSVAVTASALAASLMLVGCSSGDSGDTSADKTPSYNEELHESLPDDVKDADKFSVVMTGVNPPWYMEEGQSYTGAAAEISKAMGQILGVEIDFQPLSKISSAIASVESGRYQMAFGPYGDTSGKMGDQKRQNVEYIDMIQEIVPFLVQKGNPAGIENVFDLCGPHKIAAQVNGGAYKVLEDEAEKCSKDGKKAFKVLGVDSVPNGALAVKSERADAFFSAGAALAYYAENSAGDLEIAGEDNSNGYDDLYQGIVMPTDSELTEPIFEAIKILYEDGTYEEIMKKYNLERQILAEPGINVQAEKAK